MIVTPASAAFTRCASSTVAVIRSSRSGVRVSRPRSLSLSTSSPSISDADGLRVADGVTVAPDEQVRLGGLTLPLFVKPARAGSSRGTQPARG